MRTYCQAILITLVFFYSCSRENVQDSESGVIINANTPWIISGEQPEPVERALNDVKADWYKVFGHFPTIGWTFVGETIHMYLI